MSRILVGTHDGLHEFGVDGNRVQTHHPGRNVTAVAPEGWELWAVIDGQEVWHTAGVDWWFRAANTDGLGATCLADTRAGVIVGTSEAHLMRVAGEGPEIVPAFEQVVQSRRRGVRQRAAAQRLDRAGRPAQRPLPRQPGWIGVEALPSWPAGVVRQQHRQSLP
jgi:hypothetical protein